MGEQSDRTIEDTLQHIKRQAVDENIRITQHAQQRMAEHDIVLDEVMQAIAQGEILENYPEHRRGACCLINGITEAKRALHVICTTDQSLLIIITVYEPQPPKWVTPTRRSTKQ
jgi:hypothetical protein